MVQLYSLHTINRLFLVTTTSKSEPKLTVNISTALEKDSNKPLKSEMVNGQCSTEIEDKLLIEELDYKLMDIILFIY